ncbi:MAG: bifunctional pyr operon transcriptional regulator/uracil phosphoribosyltransferase PyrR [Flavobacteriales bacterium CG_4_10_14_0_2_um_filter_32_8]|nr:MAG: bifunctional pyr operon transcriptional regulator/uracil phosphoribosyltransferase PyrR [Flavobacteriales bacterium CG_4_10_14_0_2_um_filter_32_8]PJB16670.1 MAG: bifunctional pyr operon transcriptional regulator/uracil phosphoribosyltransferase PyrR [Flavobacteriales bacterium CG_4_9_14_3_um_filter_32_8]
MKHNDRIILDSTQFDLTIKRLAHQLIENFNDFSDTVIIGLQPRGTFLAARIKEELKAINKKFDVQVGALDVTFYRDDYRRQDMPLVPSKTDVDFVIEDKKVILIDDVLFTGRTIRSGLDAMLAFGRPRNVQLLVLINRRYERHLPIQANYIGKNVHSVISERVKVSWKETEGEDRVILYTPENE